MKKVKILTWGFAGTKKNPYGSAKVYEHKEFDGFKNKIIKVRDIYYFCGLMSFFYKGDYCCVIREENIVEI